MNKKRLIENIEHKFIKWYNLNSKKYLFLNPLIILPISIWGFGINYLFAYFLGGDFSLFSISGCIFAMAFLVIANELNDGGWAI